MSNDMIIYNTEDGKSKISLKLENGTVWLNQLEKQLSTISWLLLDMVQLKKNSNKKGNKIKICYKKLIQLIFRNWKVLKIIKLE